MKTKICAKCGIVKTLESFHVHERNKIDGRQTVCKTCKKEIDSDRYTLFPKKKESNRKRVEDLRQWVRAIKSNLHCQHCPESYWACLEFHHSDPSVKEIGISQAISHGWGKEKIMEEISKCTVLCANCHRKVHYPPGECGGCTSVFETESYVGSIPTLGTCLSS